MSSFKEKIKAGEIKRSDVMKILLEDLHEEPGFNEREEGEEMNASIADLAEYIAAGGKVPPLEVRNRDDGGAWIVDGHRRTRAYRLLDSQGRLPRDPSDNSFRINAVPFDGNDAERKLRIVTSNTNEKLGPLAVARTYKSLIGFGWSVDQIAARIGKSRSYVETEAVRKHGEAAGKFLGEKLEQAKASGKAKVTGATVGERKVKESALISERERLNFLVENSAATFKVLNEGWYVIWYEDHGHTVTKIQNESYKTPRLAIDAAIAALGTPEA
jgi:ParB-like chromosome segregation protein Spo0J